MLQGLGQNLIKARLRARGAQMAPHARVRRGPAGREDAGDGRVRDRHADPAAGQVAPHPDHLPHRRRTRARPRPSAGTRSAPWTTWSSRSCRSSSGPRWRCSSSWPRRTSCCAGRPSCCRRASRKRASWPRHAGRAGARPGAQESGARELQLRRLARPAGAAPPDRELQPGGAGEPGASGWTRPAGTTSTGCARRASRCRSSSTTCSTWPASPGRRCGSRKWT